MALLNKVMKKLKGKDKGEQERQAQEAAAAEQKAAEQTQNSNEDEGQGTDQSSSSENPANRDQHHSNHHHHHHHSSSRSGSNDRPRGPPSMKRSSSRDRLSTGSRERGRRSSSRDRLASSTTTRSSSRDRLASSATTTRSSSRDRRPLNRATSVRTPASSRGASTERRMSRSSSTTRIRSSRRGGDKGGDDDGADHKDGDPEDPAADAPIEKLRASRSEVRDRRAQFRTASRERSRAIRSSSRERTRSTRRGLGGGLTSSSHHSTEGNGEKQPEESSHHDDAAETAPDSSQPEQHSSPSSEQLHNKETVEAVSKESKDEQDQPKEELPKKSSRHHDKRHSSNHSETHEAKDEQDQTKEELPKKSSTHHDKRHSSNHSKKHEVVESSSSKSAIKSSSSHEQNEKAEKKKRQKEQEYAEKKKKQEEEAEEKKRQKEAELARKREQELQNQVRQAPQVIFHEEEAEKKKREEELAKKRQEEEEEASTIHIEMKNPAMELLSFLGASPPSPKTTEKEQEDELEAVVGEEKTVDNDLTTTSKHKEKVDESKLAVAANAKEEDPTSPQDHASDIQASPHHNKPKEEKSPVEGKINSEQEFGHDIELPLNDQTEEKTKADKDERARARRAKARANRRRPSTKEREKGRKKDGNADTNPALDLLGFIGSNYQDVIDKKTSQGTCVTLSETQSSAEKLQSSVDFFQSSDIYKSDSADNSLGDNLSDEEMELLQEVLGSQEEKSVEPDVKEQSGGEKDGRSKKVERTIKDNDDPPSSPKGLPPPSLAGDMGKNHRRRVRRTSKEEIQPVRELPPPSLAGDEHLARGSSKGRRVRRQSKTEENDAGNALPQPSLAGDEHQRKSFTRRVRRSKSDDKDSAIFCEKSLAPPSLAGDLIQRRVAPPSLAGDDLRKSARRVKKPSSVQEGTTGEAPQEDPTKKISKKQVAKAQKFMSLDEDDDEDAVSIGDDVPQASTIEKKNFRKGMMAKAKAKSVVMKNTLGTIKKTATKAASSRNIFA